MHKYLLDENLSRKLISLLSGVLPDITHVADEGLLKSFDGNIWLFAKTGNMVIITKDHDFSDMSHLYGCPPKVIMLNCGNKNSEYIAGLLISNHEVIRSFSAGSNCYLEIL